MVLCLTLFIMAVENLYSTAVEYHSPLAARPLQPTHKPSPPLVRLIQNRARSPESPANPQEESGKCGKSLWKWSQILCLWFIAVLWSAHGR